MTGEQSVVVTGVSTGIGWGITTVLIANGFTVFGSVRQLSDADRLQREFGEAFTSLIMDVTDRQAVERAAAKVSAQLGSSKLAGLVNNAGVAVPGPLLHLPLEEYRHQLEVNLTAPLSVTQVFAPLLGADLARQGAPGRIINIGSTAGKIGIPFLGAYVASKHGLEGMSEALRREMMIYGIDVIMVVPGPVATAIWDKAEATDLSAYEGTIYGPIGERFRRYMIEDGGKGSKTRMPGRNCACRTDRPATQNKLRCNSKTLQELDFASASAEKDGRHADRKTARPETDASANLRCMGEKIRPGV